MPVPEPPVTASAGLRRATATFAAIVAVVVIAMAGSAFLLSRPEAVTATSVRVFSVMLLLIVVAFGAMALRLLHVAAEAQEQVALTEDRLRALTDHALDVVAIIGPDQHVAYANRAVEQVLGRPASAYVGQDVMQWVHPDDRAQARTTLRQASADPSRAFAAEVRIAHADGSWRTMELRARGHLGTPDINGLIVNARDITHRRHTEQALHDRIRNVQLTRELARALASGGATGQALSECARVLNGHFDAALVAFWTWEPEQDALVLRASAGRDWLQRALPERVRIETGVIGRVARERRPVLHLGESRNAVGREVFAAEGEELPAAVVAALTFPLVTEDRLAGVLRVLSFEPV
jgi:PAS domain S-box-containing protein